MPSNIAQSEHKIRSLSDLRLWQDNPGRIDKDHFDKLKKKIEKRGLFKALITTPDGLIIGGNMRFRALQEMGVKDCWCSIYEPKDEADMLEVAISDNEQEAEWVQESLTELLYKTPIEYEMYAVNMGKPINLKDLMDSETSETVEDEAPEVSTEPAISKLGEIYQLGVHKIACGDSTDRELWDRLLGTDAIDMVFADPPYGVDYGAKNRFLNSFQKAGRNLEDIKNDMLGKDELFDMLVKAFTNAYDAGADHCSYYVTAPQGGELGLMMMMMMMSAGLPTRHVLIWNKNHQNFSLGRLDYEYKHEPILYTWKKNHIFYGGGKCKNSVWDIDKPRSAKEHPTMKPIELIANAILNSSKKGELIMDMFMGSGSTLIASEQTGRRSIGIELAENYVDVIRKRYWKFTHDNNEEGWVEGTPVISSPTPQ